MRAECIPGHSFVANYVPYESSHNGIQVFAQLRPQPQYMWDPSNGGGDNLQRVRTDCNAKRTGMIVDRRYPPGHQRLSAAFSANFEIVANPFDPLTKPAFKGPAAEIANLVMRIRSRPGMDGITCAKRMAELEVSRPRNRIPDFLRRCRDLPPDGYGPFESRRRYPPHLASNIRIMTAAIEPM